MTVTKRIVDELLSTKLNDIPDSAKERMTRLIVDTFGTTYGGIPIVGEHLTGYVRDVAATQEAVVIGADMRSSVEMAAGVNAQLGRTLDFEETGPGIHIGPSLIHTVFAIGQRTGASGAEMLTTACVVYEINGRFHYARRDGDIQRHINICLTMAAARLLGLDAETTNLAMGLSWNYPVRRSQLLGPPEPKRISRMGLGNLWMCQDGIQAALLAMYGYGELPDELDRRDGEYDLDAMTSSPEPFFYTADEIQLKPWPSSRLSQGGIQLTQELMEEHGLAVGDIEHIVVHLPWIYLKPHQFEPDPQSFLEGIYSIQWGTALGIMGLEAGAGWFTDEQLADEAARDLTGRIEIREDTDASKVFDERRFAQIRNTVELTANGKTYTKTALMHDILGSAGMPMPKAMLEGKFLRLVAPEIGADRAAALLGALNGFASASSAKDIAELL